MRKLNIIGVSIFLEKRKSRQYVGLLSRCNGHLIFKYDDSYFKSKHAIPLGPEFPLTQKQFSSEKLFLSLEDRIPSNRNPAYPEYCRIMGIDPEEQDPLVLLATIGKKGPSSFIFYPVFDQKITPERVITFRESLGLTTREFANVFEFSQSSLNALERNRIEGAEILKRLDILINFPEVALDLLVLNGGYLTQEKFVKLVDKLKRFD